MKIKGKNIVIEIDVAGTWVPYACASTATLELSTSFIETAMPGDGVFSSFLPQKNSFVGSLEGFTAFEEAGKISLEALRALQIAQTKFHMRFKRTSGANEYTEEGYFYIENSTDTSPYAGFSTFTVDVRGTGPLGQNIVNPVLNPFDYKYGYTTIDTTLPYVDDAAMWAAIIASVEAANTALNYSTGTAADVLDPVQVDYAQTGYFVRFLIFPSAVTDFNYWSEIGNILQQNVPISTGQSGVWRSDVIGTGEKVIATRYQTAFTNEIKFTR